MRIMLNGEEREFAGIKTVEELVSHLELDNSRIATELNFNVVRKSDYAATELEEGDKLEIVTFVGGG